MNFKTIEDIEKYSLSFGSLFFLNSNIKIISEVINGDCFVIEKNIGKRFILKRIIKNGKILTVRCAMKFKTAPEILNFCKSDYFLSGQADKDYPMLKD